MIVIGGLFLVLASCQVGGSPSNRSFVIDYEHDRFLKDGRPYQYVAGSMHYFRVPSAYWADRLAKLRAAGLDAVQFYVAWNVHEPRPGRFDFAGDADLLRFVRLAQAAGLDVIMRMGPYTCGEFENGGLPWWLLKIPDIRMRQADPRFLYYVTKWYVKLMPMLLPYLYQNGGPIISMQIENEYGSRSYCDGNYTGFLRDLTRSYVGPDFVLFTVDGAGVDYLRCGVVPGVYPTVDFGCGSRRGVADAFAAQRAYAPRGPLVNSEFYPGWLDLWGQNHSTVATDAITSSMAYMYQMGASFNFYMFEGGTNFGYMNGASSDNEPVTTSYDYDAPLSEAGDPTPKFMELRRQIQALTGREPPPVPPPSPKARYGPAPAVRLGDLFDLLDALAPPATRRTAAWPVTFELLDFPYGFVLYETRLPDACAGCLIDAPGVNDRGHVMIDREVRGWVAIKKTTKVNVGGVAAGAMLRILVENNGRQCSGFNDPKGIVGNVTADGRVLTGWTMYPLVIENVFKLLEGRRTRSGDPPRPETVDSWAPRRQVALETSPAASGAFVPSIYYSKFQAPRPADTYFDPSGWGKGQVFLNGFNLGRYWPSLGPQVTLYVPGVVVRKLNYAVLFELERPGNCRDAQMFNCAISFRDQAILNQTVPGPRRRSTTRWFSPTFDGDE